MYTIPRCLLACALLLTMGCIFAPSVATTQVLPLPDCWNEPGQANLLFPFPRLADTPPLSSDMPLDVMIGYIVFDSVSRSVSLEQFGAALLSLESNDSLRYAQRYLYAMMDYDPVRWQQYKRHSTGQRRAARIKSDAFEGIVNTLKDKFNASFTDLVITENSYIAHIRAIDTFSVDNSKAALASTVHIVTAEILDPIKGKTLPAFVNFYPLKPGDRGEDDVPNALGSCDVRQVAPGEMIQFSYAEQWQRIPFGSNIAYSTDTMVDSRGAPWVKDGNEYIVFLGYYDYCIDADYTHNALSVKYIRSSMNNIYPVVDGIVIDPNDDFGFGSGLDVDTFKAALRSKIFSITNYGE